MTLGTAATSLVDGTAVNVTGGTLNSNNGAALGSLAKVTLSTGATLGVGASQTLGALNGAAGSSVKIGANTLTVGSTNNLNSLLDGVITDGGAGGSLVKAGSGIMTLTGANTYGTVGVTGTTVSAGKLLVNNTTGSGTGVGNVLVNGGILGGSGHIDGSVSVTSGALSPGASINHLDIGGTLSMSGGSFDYEINSNTVTADLNTVAGNLLLSGGVALSASDLGSSLLAMGTKFTLINYGGTWNGGTFAGLPNYASNLVIGSNRFAIKYNDTTGGTNFGGGTYGFGSGQPHYVTITAVPEASAFLTVALGGIFAVAAVWMSKRMGVSVLKI